MEGDLSREDLQTRLEITDRKYFRIDFLTPAIDAGLVEMTNPEKPNSSNQRYRLTSSGRKLKESTIHAQTAPEENLE
jgi:hypothetical protein